MRGWAMVSAGAILAAAVAAGETADELIAKNIQARGGLEKIRAIQSMRLTGTMKVGSETMHSVLELKRPTRSRWEFSLGSQTAVQAFDGKTGWMVMPFAGRTEPEEMSAEDLKDVEQQADIDGPLVDYQAKGSKIELVGHDPDLLPEDWKLKVTLKSGETRYIFLDPGTYLQTLVVTKKKFDGAEVEIRSSVGGYKDVGGVMLPHAFSAATRDGGETQSLVFEKIELNVPIDDSRFRMPEPKKPALSPGSAPTPAIS